MDVHPKYLELIDAAIQSEINYLTGQGLLHKGLAETVVVLRATMTQGFMCFSTSGVNHTNNMIRHLCGICQGHFVMNGEVVNAAPRRASNSYGRALMAMDKCITDAQNALVRGAVGDAKSHLMDLLAACKGCFCEFGVEARKGYEPEKE